MDNSTRNMLNSYLNDIKLRYRKELNRLSQLTGYGSSYEDINESMQKAYKGALINQGPAPSIQLASWKNAMEKRKAEFPPFRPHELIHRTRDGTMNGYQNDFGPFLEKPRYWTNQVLFNYLLLLKLRIGISFSVGSDSIGY